MSVWTICLPYLAVLFLILTAWLTLRRKDIVVDFPSCFVGLGAGATLMVVIALLVGKLGGLWGWMSLGFTVMLYLMGLVLARACNQIDEGDDDQEDEPEPNSPAPANLVQPDLQPVTTKPRWSQDEIASN